LFGTLSRTSNALGFLLGSFYGGFNHRSFFGQQVCIVNAGVLWQVVQMMLRFFQLPFLLRVLFCLNSKLVRRIAFAGM